ncbi:hypothetical protein JCM10212_002652 [Sporobolomyces blumeae]
MQATSLSFVDTVYSADSIEFCPARPNLFACGTYQVVKSEENKSSKSESGAASVTGGSEQDEGEDEVKSDPTVTRYGRCLLYSVDNEGKNVKELQRFDGPAILDMKWSPRLWNGNRTLAIADAKGHVQLHKLDDETCTLSPIDTVTCADEKTLCLSLDWSTRHPSSADPASIIVSLSSGSLTHLTGESTLTPTRTWHAHDFEPWITSFDCWDTNTVWSGGDDLKLKGWDLRTDCEEPTFVNKRFEGGVTTITSHPLVENLIAVGSYDSQVRLFDRRNPLRPLSTFDVGGGIWRLKWHPTNPNRLLVAAMHNGFSVIDYDLAPNAIGSSETDRALIPGGGELVRRFEGHESLAYGVDWSDGAQTAEGRDLVASCSFYDHAMHVWAV